ncbi:MAG: hypothetical protein HQ551_10695 [Desulfobacteraceae bacterium]|nr:hypothetical protein [Desulfobacteraceae bacterium]
MSYSSKRVIGEITWKYVTALPEGITGKDLRVQEIFAFFSGIAESDSAVLIEGSTGPGKELFA